MSSFVIFLMAVCQQCQILQTLYEICRLSAIKDW